MESSKLGSATLLILIVMTFLCFVGITAFQTVTMLHDLAMQRVSMQQQNHTEKALINYAIACCKSIHPQDNKKERYEYTIDPWPHTTYKGIVEITLNPLKTLKKTGKPRWYEITAQLIQDRKKISQLSCVVWADKTGWRAASFVG